ncbi:hypothetical protein [Streptomyces qinglanensis]|uniref:Uncharacterized protein n=1 Tax=Streptomyces qinglanensis TaxID=943816 RepID=A0A1H9VBP9_9ACTN|nr:hypothetical protein [Streptomyces qinglanensis]SES18693.1 hypothetical protein SAMN05421870_11185 [Streptomyces qinglanensis]
MADDRYSWLDEETAERLLRGLPVEAGENGRPDSGSGPAAEARDDGPEGGSSAERGSPAGRRESAQEHADPAAGQSARADSAAGTGRSGRRAGGRLDVPSPDWFREADRRTAARLAAALDELSTAHSAPLPTAPGTTPVELPGEAAALDAFRAARVAAGHGGTTTAAAADALGGGGALGGARSRTRHILTGRPLRAGFAVALAGCALGGVAVAAGAGVLPTPFSSGDAPAATASPAASSGSESPEEGGGSGAGTPGRDSAGERHGGRDRSTRPGGGGGEDGDGGGADGGKGSGQDGSSRDLADGGTGGDLGGNGSWRDRPGGTFPGAGGHHGGHGGSRKEAIAEALCKAYAADKLETDDRRKLERAAGGRAVVRRFCARHGESDSSGGGGGESAGGGGGQSTGSGGGSGESAGGGDGGGDTGGSGGADTGGSGASGGGVPSEPSDPAPSTTAGTAAPTRQ